MDFALFMERYGYRILLVVLLGGAFAFIFGMLGYEMTLAGYSVNEVAFFIGLFIVAAVIGAFAGRFMNTMLTVASRISYTYRSKLFEGKKRIEKEREKLREEGGKVY
ncbi:hypothetical protein [Thermococcus sp.]|uniref:hypothetical protein n=1 Tax=Thermococcus sp. TaxID=35749 RepID=UPI0025E5A9C9|nr:hypothetical protein [Thermococcus sp.]